MRIWPISDLHMRTRDALDLVKPLGEFPEADVCVLAGDVCDGLNAAVNWVGKVIRPRMPVVMVLGNHEHYGTSIETARKSARLIADALGVTLLDDGAAVIGGVRFLGGTLWTDYALYAGDPDPAARGLKVREAMKAAKYGLSDHSQIDMSDVKGGVMSRLFKPRDALALHVETRRFLEGALAEHHDGPTVVVTHHAPHPGSIAPQFVGDPATPAFVSDLSDLIEDRGPDLWIHGHVHNPCDYRVGRTRVVCNPRGYTNENRAFEWRKVVEV